jgi:hypothetical protein
MMIDYYDYRKIKDGLVINSNGLKSYLKNNVLHRLRGPAKVEQYIHLHHSIPIIYTIPNWYYNGRWFDCNSQKDFEKKVRLSIFK